MQTISTLPADFKDENTGAEIEVDPKGHFVYASNRGHNSIAVFAIDQQKGTLTSVDYGMTPGREPRGFTFDPTGNWLLVGNQMIGTISIFRRDPNTGKLTRAPQTAEIDKAVCLLFV